jgi:hypothetical protein
MMDEIDNLMTELNSLDDQIAQCIERFETTLRTHLSISVSVDFQHGALKWTKLSGAWTMAWEEAGNVTSLKSVSRVLRMAVVREGFAVFFKQIKPALEENIIERKQALQAFAMLEREIDRTLT